MVDHVTLIGEKGNPEAVHGFESIMPLPKEYEGRETAFEREKEIILKGNFHAVGKEFWDFSEKSFKKMVAAKTVEELEAAIETEGHDETLEACNFLVGGLVIAEKKSIKGGEAMLGAAIEKQKELKPQKDALYKEVLEEGIKFFPMDATVEEAKEISKDFSKLFEPMGKLAAYSAFIDDPTILMEEADIPKLEGKAKELMIKKMKAMLLKEKRSAMKKIILIVLKGLLYFPSAPLRILPMLSFRSELRAVKKKLEEKNLSAKKRKKLMKKKKKLEKHEARVEKHLFANAERFLNNIPEFRAVAENRTRVFCRHILYAIDYFHKKGIKDVRLAAICGTGHVDDERIGIVKKRKGLASLLRQEKIKVKVEYV